MIGDVGKEDTKRGCDAANEAEEPVLLPFTRKPGSMCMWQVF
jgi:hypothetical protein